jgi:hypothetical protein
MRVSSNSVVCHRMAAVQLLSYGDRVPQGKEHSLVPQPRGLGLLMCYPQWQALSCLLFQSSWRFTH